MMFISKSLSIIILNSFKAPRASEFALCGFSFIIPKFDNKLVSLYDFKFGKINLDKSLHNESNYNLCCTSKFILYNSVVKINIVSNNYFIFVISKIFSDTSLNFGNF